MHMRVHIKSVVSDVVKWNLSEEIKF